MAPTDPVAVLDTRASHPWPTCPADVVARVEGKHGTPRYGYHTKGLGGDV